MEPRRARSSAASAPPPVLDDPLHAARILAAGGRAAFRCAVSRLVWSNGLGLGPDRWHPFAATVEEFLATGRPAYRGSVLEHYYAVWRPRNALQALIADLAGPERLRREPGWAYVLPWSDESIAARRRLVERVFRKEYGPAFDALPSLEHGFPRHGPLDPTLGRVELGRLLRVADAIRREGYRRAGAFDGDIRGELLVRDGDYRVLVEMGNHRAAAVSALGFDEVPVRLCSPRPIGLDPVDRWPLVRRGLWERSDAATYFHHLFDFDSRGWARKQGLLSGRR